MNQLTLCREINPYPFYTVEEPHYPDDGGGINLEGTFIAYDSLRQELERHIKINHLLGIPPQNELRLRHQESSCRYNRNNNRIISEEIHSVWPIIICTSWENNHGPCVWYTSLDNKCSLNVITDMQTPNWGNLNIPHITILRIIFTTRGIGFSLKPLQSEGSTRVIRGAPFSESLSPKPNE
ncbi:hypothetical protein NPIL_91601 [Nephila pilipes]|uniref:Uncharacterized protein n=1 Tax=Nephila pilipes TaxID=299642 RepID=A0A8X6NXU4_NEPPI|nr:hypothetical protein NPIL_91601 [Nephila pilipes]